MLLRGVVVFAILFPLALGGVSPVDAQPNLAAGLRDLGPIVPPGSDEAKLLSQMLTKDVKARRDLANRHLTKLWEGLKTKEDWEKFRGSALEALRQSLGQWPAPPQQIPVHITKTLHGDGFLVHNIVFESRPHLVVTGNLYRPEKPVAKMPGILLSHSHHNPVTQCELRDMGMLWARQGCYVLALEHLGHGERRQHEFSDSTKYPEKFAPDRQDYYYRYQLAQQLHLVGESLIGWMAWDLMRGVDVLYQQKGIDKERIILLGAVAGGGDPAAVTAALDPRVTVVAPFNFGGPQPETVFPLPADADAAFNYLGGGSWESTRSLRLSGPGAFAPWVIVGATAPRYLIYGHEFAWDQHRDPVWKRLQKIYDWYGVPERLAFTIGRGSVKGKPPESTHCNNIGAEHRKWIYKALKQWFNMPEPEEYRKRFTAEELRCLTPEITAKLKPWPVHKLALEMARERLRLSWQRLRELTDDQRKMQLRQDWAKLLGDVVPAKDFKVQATPTEVKELSLVNDMVLLRVPGKDGGLETVLPVRLLKLSSIKKPRGMVVAVSQGGGQAFLKNRAETIAGLLEQGMVVCLPDLRGTGASKPADDSRGRGSVSTSVSASEQMLGQTLLGERLRDLLVVLRYMRTLHPAKDAPLLLWGDSFAPVNVKEPYAAPLELKQPHQAEPLGSLVTLLAALYDDEVRALHVHGGLGSYLLALEHPCLQVPHDAIVPGMLTIGDVSDLVAALAPRAIWLEAMVDGLNRPLPAPQMPVLYAPALTAYQKAGHKDQLTLPGVMEATPQRLVEWLAAQAKR
jgi:cephalosporin-C deacetylase-like acetyl esterase